MSSLKKRRKAPRPLDKRILVQIACNNGNNGLFEGTASAISFASAFDLECHWTPPKLTELENGIRIFRKVWPILGSIYGYGNWCWNGYWMTVERAVAFFYAARRSDKFSSDGGWCSLVDIWDRADEDPIALAVLLGQASTEMKP